MQVIKTGLNYNHIIKYIIIDENNNTLKIIPAVKKNKDDIMELFNNLSGEYNLKILPEISQEIEIAFIWPQVLKEIKEKDNSVGRWLAGAKIFFDNNIIKISAETKIAYKIINQDKYINYIKNRYKYFTGFDIKIEIGNGNFLKDIVEDIDKKKYKIVKDNKESFKRVILGNLINKEINYEINDIQEEDKNVIISGELFDYKKRKTRGGKELYILDITDKIDSITVKFFLDEGEKLLNNIKTGEELKVKGGIRYDRYSKELIIMADDINRIKKEERSDNSPEKRIELHLHTKMSSMDSVVDVNKIVKRAADWGHSALAITDHGVVQAFPDAYNAGEKYGIKILYGLEAYMVDDGEPIIINPPGANIGEKNYVVFDLETTGLSPYNNEIIEIGAVKIKDGMIIDTFGELVKPDKIIPDFIVKLTGIDNKKVRDARKINDVLLDFFDFVEDSILVAHNASFDYSFLQAATEQDIVFPLLDTLGLSRALFPDIKNHKLSTLTEYFNVNLKNHHRAVDDAKATAEIFVKLLDHMSDDSFVSYKDLNRLTANINWKNLPLYHTTILARNQTGLKRLYELISNSHLKYFYKKPRILKSELMQKRNNLLIGSACESGQLYKALLQKKSEDEIKNYVKFYDYLEIQPLENNAFLIPDYVNDMEELKKINKKIYDLGQKYNKPVVATGDVHFIDPEDEIYREILQTGQGYKNADQQAPLYFRTSKEMLLEFDYLGEDIAHEVCIDNPEIIADKINKLKPVPDGLFTPEIDGAEDTIKNMSYSKAHELYGDNLPEIIEKRLEKELYSIIENGYAVIYLIAHKLVKKSLEDGYLVGSRGSVGSSLVATMCGITEVNSLPPHYRCSKCKYVEFVEGESTSRVGVDLPSKTCPKCGAELVKDGFDIPFEVFMGLKGDKVPDIDLNFSGEYQSTIHRETENLFGRDYVYRAGTISTIADRTAYGFVKGYLTDNNLIKRKAEINRLVSGCSGVKRTTGQHPGGLMVVPKNMNIHDFSPIQRPANDQSTDVRTTHFDYHSISGRILKLDLLGHDDPTTLRMLQDITGVQPDEIPLDDEKTMSLFSNTEALGLAPEDIGTEVGTLGIPEFGTSFVQQMLTDTKPNTFAELLRISGLSHGTDVWLNNAQDVIKAGLAELSEVISVRDDIFNFLIEKGLEPGRAFWIMEHVRKGKGLNEKEEKYIRDFSIPEWYIDSCKKIKYMFPKAHAAAYVMMAFRIAYFKVHYPQAFYKTYFSIKANDFDAGMVSNGYEYIISQRKILREKGNDLTAKEKGMLTVLKIVIEAIKRGIKFCTVDLYESDKSNFIISDDGLIPPLISVQGLGKSAAESIVESRKEGKYSSIEDLVNRTGVTKTVVEVLKNYGALEGLPERNQLSLF